jgi:hypothetical protein
MRGIRLLDMEAAADRFRRVDVTTPPQPDGSMMAS